MLTNVINECPLYPFREVVPWYQLEICSFWTHPSQHSQNHEDRYLWSLS